MRIGYLTYGLDRAPTGIGRYSVELLRALAELPNSPEIVLLSTERQDLHGLWDMFEHHKLPGCRLLPGIMTLGQVMLSEAGRRYRLDLIHDPNGIAPFLGPKLGVQRIVTIHDAFPYVHAALHNRLDNWRYRHQLPLAVRRADAVITVSECSRIDLLRYLGLSTNQVQVIAEGVAPRFKPVSGSVERQAILRRYEIKQPYIFYVGGINGRKNIARLFEAYARVQEQHHEVRLVIGGKRQWQTHEIDESFRRLNLTNHVHFTGYIDDADLPALYSAAELFVFPSLYEGFGLPTLEAMACGTAVVTANLSSLPEVVGQAALTVNPYDVVELAAAIKRVLEDKDLRLHLQQCGLKRAAQFTWRGTATETMAVYEKVLAQVAPLAPHDPLSNDPLAQPTSPINNVPEENPHEI